MKLSVDFETRSPVDLKKCGSFVYFGHPDTTVLMAAYRIDDGPLKCWAYKEPKPADLCDAIAAGATIHAHNAQFEALGFDLLAGRFGWPRPRLDQFRDTAAAAAAMALPRALGDLGPALGLEVVKDKDGMRLIRKFSIPRKPRKDEPPGLYWNEPEDHPEDFALFKKYCMRDVETEEAAAKRMVPLSDEEQAIWLLDQRINRRGVRIDVTSARAATALADKAKLLLDREMRAVTNGFVSACSQPGKLIEWVQAQGIEIASAAKADITELLDAEDLPAHVRTALLLRQEAAKTSVAKLTSMVARASADDRVRGGFIYHGASTGRWVSTGVNLANLPRPRRVFDEQKPGRPELFQAFRTRSPEYLKLLYGDDLGRPLHLISDAIRGFIWAAPGHDLLQADYSGIEGAVIAWLADEHWKLEALHDIIADPSLPDMYRRTAASIMGTTTDVITKKHPLRQSVGKVSELALGFGGGPSAFFSMARNYGVDLDSLFGPVWETADTERRERAVKRYESCAKRGSNQTDTLSRNAWVACELIKLGWRATNPQIAESWRLLEDAVRSAIREPGVQFTAARCTYLVARGFLWCRLPSGRCLAYGSPKLKDQVWAKIKLDDGVASSGWVKTPTWSDAEVMDREEAEVLERRGKVLIQGATSPRITTLGVNGVTKKWERQALYGGLLAENNTQAVARDLLVNGMLRAEAAGYPVIAHVYDEIVTEVPRGWGDVSAFESLICELPEWAKQGSMPMPLTAGGWRGKRYRKD